MSPSPEHRQIIHSPEGVPVCSVFMSYAKYSSKFRFCWPFDFHRKLNFWSLTHEVIQPPVHGQYPLPRGGAAVGLGYKVLPVHLLNHSRILEARIFCRTFRLQEIISHLGKSHLIMEIPLVAMNRQLPKEHPVFTLLQPHLEGTAFINWGAQEVQNLQYLCIQQYP